MLSNTFQVEQLHKIFKLCGSPSEEFWASLKLSRATVFKPQHLYHRCVNNVYKGFSSSALELLDQLLAVDPASRGTAASALESEVSFTLLFFIAAICHLLVRIASWLLSFHIVWFASSLCHWKYKVGILFSYISLFSVGFSSFFIYFPIFCGFFSVCLCADVHVVWTYIASFVLGTTFCFL